MAVENHCLISMLHYQLYICDFGKRWQNDTSGESGYFNNLQIKIHRGADFVLISLSIYRHPVELVVSGQSAFSSSADIIYQHGQHYPGWDRELASWCATKKKLDSTSFFTAQKKQIWTGDLQMKGLMTAYPCIMHLLPNAIFGLLIQVEKTPYKSGLLLVFTVFF